VIHLFKKQQDIVKKMSDEELLRQLLFTQIIILIISICLAFFLFDSYNAFISIFEMNTKKVFLIGAFVALSIIILDFILMNVFPPSFFDDGGINKRLFQKRNLLEIISLTLLIAFCEELLFRGVLQTHFGLIVASIIFAILHIRYLTKWLLFTMVVLVSFLLGVVYEWTENLWTTIFIHFVIDFVFALQIRYQYILDHNKGDGE